VRGRDEIDRELDKRQGGTKEGVRDKRQER